MKNYAPIITKLEEKLEQLENNNQNIIEYAESAIILIKHALEETRKIVINTRFTSKANEILFFKRTKPQIYSKLIYYVKLFSIESKRPRSSNKSQVKYLNAHIDNLQRYFNENLEFYHYYRSDASFLDKLYFLRGKIDIRLHPDSLHSFTDKQFSTSHDATVANIIAYDLLIVYLKKEIDKLENYNMELSTGVFQSQSKLFWTGNKTDLIELIYALHSSGVVNSGTADIKELASACEQIFNITLGDYYRAFLEIRSRKINQTKFIDKLKKSLVNKMLESDE